MLKHALLYKMSYSNSREFRKKLSICLAVSVVNRVGIRITAHVFQYGFLRQIWKVLLIQYHHSCMIS